MTSLNKSPKLLVWLVTYNHQNYIRESLDSILNQKTNFDFKILIGEDFSTDDTRKICEEYKKKYPENIELYLHSRNIGSNANGLYLYEKCFESDASYIALCEGDDYWTDPLKLQKQVDFLEGNPEYIGCFHNTDVLNQNEPNPELKPWRTYTKNDFSLKDT